MGRRSVALGLCLVLGACGDDSNVGTSTPAGQSIPAAPTVTTADFRNADGAARCSDGEMMLNALCYPDPDRSLVAQQRRLPQAAGRQPDCDLPERRREHTGVLHPALTPAVILAGARPDFSKKKIHIVYALVLLWDITGKSAMTARTASEKHAKPVNLRIREDVRAVIDRAARVRGKTRSDFMIDAAYRAAEDTLLDQTLIRVDAESYAHYLAVLDQPPGGEGFERLMSAPKPWPE